MTNFTDTLKRYEKETWKNGSTWQRARIAYRHNAMNELNVIELQEIINTVSDMNFYAEMSDNYKITIKEKKENNAIAKVAKELL